jgi:FHS family Na+ dependent glucose MFS transporter 1
MDTPNSSTVGDSTISSDKNRITSTIGYLAAFMAYGMVVALLGPTIPSLAEHTRSSLSEISILFTARSLGHIVGALYVARFYDRLPGHTVLGASLLVMGLTVALIPIMPLLWLLVIILLILGITEGSVDVGGNTLLVWVHRKKVDPFMNALHFLFGLGAFLGPIIVAQTVMLSDDINLAYWVVALILVPVIVWVIRVPSPKPTQKAEETQLLRGEIVLIILIALFFFLHVGAELSFGDWIYTYAVSLDLASVTTAAYITSAFWGSITLGRLIGIPITTRIRPRIILLSSLIGAVVSVGIILVWSDSITALWVGAIGTGLSMASLFPSTITFAGRRLNITGRMTGWFFIGVGAGSMTLPWIIGQFFETIGPLSMMVIIISAILLALVVLGMLIRYKVPGAYSSPTA